MFFFRTLLFARILSDRLIGSRLQSTKMNTILNPWKEAATLILVAKTTNLQKLGSHLDSTTITSIIKDQQSADQDQVNLSNDLSDKSRIRLNRVLELINKTDYRVMMVKRSSLSSFMASAYVFPGKSPVFSF